MKNIVAVAAFGVCLMLGAIGASAKDYSTVQKGSVATVDTSWQIAGIGDFNGDLSRQKNKRRL